MMGNFIDFLKDLSGDPEGYIKKQKEDYKKSKKERFNIGGQSGFKWLSTSANKTWIEGGKIVRDKKGKTISK
tara:strand:+ start:60 stop:275 length:216 start_codon:yes stop_codon:yes gene_type:complete